MPTIFPPVEHLQALLAEAERQHKWIQKAISKPGALHKALHVPADEKIPAGKLAVAAKKPGKMGHRARLAQTLSRFAKR